MLGGIVVDFGDKTIDLSVQSRVTRLNNLLQRQSLELLFIAFCANATAFFRVGLSGFRTDELESGGCCTRIILMHCPEQNLDTQGCTQLRHLI